MTAPWTPNLDSGVVAKTIGGEAAYNQSEETTIGIVSPLSFIDNKYQSNLRLLGAIGLYVHICGCMNTP